MKDNQKVALGEKLRNFRKRAGMSQLELEAAIQTSPGVISRIEAGKVNPTKETLLQIGKVLNLKENDLADLLEIRPITLSNKEIEAAITECKSYLDKENVLAYLIDENGFVHYAGKGFTTFFNADSNWFERCKGKEILEIALDPQYGILDMLDFEKSKHTLAVELLRGMRESSLTTEYLNTKLSGLPQAQEVIALAKTLDPQEALYTSNKHVFFNINGQSVDFLYGREPLKGSKRFEIVEFSPVTHQ